jgi:hypothetical protein
MASALAQLLRATPGTPDSVRQAMEGMDGRELVRDCVRHGLSALARHELEKAGIDLPMDAAADLKRHALSVAANAVKVKGVLLRVLDALHKHDIDPVLLKGYGLASRFYPDPLLRPMSDVDLLISPRQLSAAKRALVEVGLSMQDAEMERYWRAHTHHLTFNGAAAAVELHFTAIKDMGSSIEADALLARAISDTLEGRHVRYLRPEDEVTYLSTHATHHLLSGAGWLYDLKLLLKKHPHLDWLAVVSLAEESEMQSAVYFALKAARDLIGAEIPDSALHSLRPPRWQAALGDLLFSGDRLVASPIGGGRFSWAVNPLLSSNLSNLARATLFAGWRAPLRKFARHFPKIAPRNWRA